MEKAPIKGNEEERLKSLEKLNLQSTACCENLNRLAKLATKLLGMPTSVISVIDANTERYQSACGTDRKEEARENSISGHALYAEDVFVVSDTQQDPRFADNPLVTGEPFVRSYAGVPLYSDEGHQAIGAFCVEGKEPKTFSQEELECLKELAKLSESELNKHKTSSNQSEAKVTEKSSSDSSNFFELIFEKSNVPILSWTTDSNVTHWNKAAEELYGYSEEEMLGQSIRTIFPEGLDDVNLILEKVNRAEDTNNYETVRQKKDGTLLNISLSIFSLRDEAGQIKEVGIIARDITKLKEAESQTKQYLSELERFNKILIDREVRMIELKEEIKRLNQNPQ